MKIIPQFSVEACQYVDSLPLEVSQYIRAVVDDMSQEPVVSRQMLVSSWTINLPDHIYRAMKIYRTPGYRVIFHRLSKRGVYIDKIAARCDNPYEDGY